MPEMLSPGVYVTEIDASTIVPTVSNSIAVTTGNFVKGPVDSFLLITSVADLITYYGYPTNENYNDWYQAYNFLQYGNKLLVSRAANIGGTATLSGASVVGDGAIVWSYLAMSGITVTVNALAGSTDVELNDASGVSIGNFLSFDQSTQYEVQDIVGNVVTFSTALADDVILGTQVYMASSTEDTTYEEGSTQIIEVSTAQDLAVGMLISFGTNNVVYMITSIVNEIITLDRDLENDIEEGMDINIWTQCMNGAVEVTSETVEYTLSQETWDSETEDAPDFVLRTTDAHIAYMTANPTVTFEYTKTYDLPAKAVDSDAEYIENMIVIPNSNDWETSDTNGMDAVAFTNPADSKIKFIARNPGAWSGNLEICIALPIDFVANSTNPDEHVYKFAFEGLSVDDYFEYAPEGSEIGIIVKDGDAVVEVWTVDFDEDAKDHNNKSTYIENIINKGSNYLFVKVNSANPAGITSSCLFYDEDAEQYVGSPLELVNGSDSEIQQDDLMNAYELFENKEELDIDIVIANELDGGVSAKNLCDTRKDCIGFIGANYGDTVGKKSAQAISALVEWRKRGAVNYNNMFVVACANYKYQYDRYNDKYRWVNIAGDIAGLRAQTSMNRASWWASAGLERGQIKNVTKLAFNPTQGQRDILYKNGLNPIVAFPGQGTVMWGQKTLLSKPSSFDRVNVRGLFNTMERALSKMAKYQIMEFNDTFTRNRIVSMIKPYLGSVQAGRGIQDFLVICDESNNTPDVISRNQLIVDIYIKPTYVAEFINLRFTNAGTNSFSEVIGG